MIVIGWIIASALMFSCFAAILMARSGDIRISIGRYLTLIAVLAGASQLPLITLEGADVFVMGVVLGVNSPPQLESAYLLSTLSDGTWGVAVISAGLAIAALVMIVDDQRKKSVRMKRRIFILVVAFTVSALANILAVADFRLNAGITLADHRIYPVLQNGIFVIALLGATQLKLRPLNAGRQSLNSGRMSAD